MIENKESLADTKNPCVFPFKWENKTYKSCTRMDGFSNNTPEKAGFWCATSVDVDLDVRVWGFCNDLCPLEGTIYFFQEDLCLSWKT